MSNDELEDTEESTTAEDEQEPVDLTEQNPEDIDPDQLAEQDWTLGEGPTEQYVEFKQMVFHVEDPDDDAVLNMMAQAEMGEGDTSERMYQLCDSAITDPELSPERWGQMRMSERIGLMVRVAEAIGLSDMIDFPEGGPGAQQAG
jgi:hypothetical protein